VSTDPRTPKPEIAGDPAVHYERVAIGLRNEADILRLWQATTRAASDLAADHAHALRRWADAERRLDGIDDSGWRRLQALEGITTMIRDSCADLPDPGGSDEDKPERLVMAVLERLAVAERQLAELRQTPTPAPIADRVAVLREAYRVADAAAVESQVRQLDGHATMGLMLDRLHQLAWPLSYRPADPPPPTDPA
jgi:hypothetical protein